MLITPWYNADQPRVLGMPVLYWSQFLWVVVGVISVFLVYRMTRDGRGSAVPEPEPGVDTLDEGAAATGTTTAVADEPVAEPAVAEPTATAERPAAEEPTATDEPAAAEATEATTGESSTGESSTGKPPTEPTTTTDEETTR
jgi:hypothetical protein